MTTKANERQVGGDHYKTGGEEHWDRVHRLGLTYFQGQITKYVERCHKKNGIEDLRKARHFLDKYIELLEKNTVETVGVTLEYIEDVGEIAAAEAGEETHGGAGGAAYQRRSGDPGWGRG